MVDGDGGRRRIGDTIDTSRNGTDNVSRSSDLRLRPAPASDANYENVEPELVGWDKNRQGSKISVHFSLPGFGDGTSANGSRGVSLVVCYFSLLHLRD